LGTVDTNLLKRFWVFDPDETGNVEKRFREVLGHGALQAFKPFAGNYLVKSQQAWHTAACHERDHKSLRSYYQV
jgi:hypothetical protein